MMLNQLVKELSGALKKEGNLKVTKITLVGDNVDIYTSTKGKPIYHTPVPDENWNPVQTTEPKEEGLYFTKLAPYATVMYSYWDGKYWRGREYYSGMALKSKIQDSYLLRCEYAVWCGAK